MQSRYSPKASMVMEKQLNQSTEQSLQHWGSSPSYQPALQWQHARHATKRIQWRTRAEYAGTGSEKPSPIAPSSQCLYSLKARSNPDQLST